MIITIGNAQVQTISAIGLKVSAIGQALTSEKAQNIYRGILTAIALVAVVIAIGLGKAAQYYWAEWIRPASIVAWAYGREEIRKAVDRAQLAGWLPIVGREAGKLRFSKLGG